MLDTNSSSLNMPCGLDNQKLCGKKSGTVRKREKVYYKNRSTEFKSFYIDFRSVFKTKS